MDSCAQVETKNALSTKFQPNQLPPRTHIDSYVQNITHPWSDKHVMNISMDSRFLSMKFMDVKDK